MEPPQLLIWDGMSLSRAVLRRLPAQDARARKTFWQDSTPGKGREPKPAQEVSEARYGVPGAVLLIDAVVSLLFEKPGYGSSTPIREYDLSLDGNRFLMAKDEQRKPTPVTEMILMQNWFDEWRADLLGLATHHLCFRSST